MLKRLSNIYLIVFLALFAQCGPIEKITESDKYQLDPNFAGYKGALIIVRKFENKQDYYHGYDDKIVTAFQKYYKGEILSISETELTKYSDLEKYRFYIQPVIIRRYNGTWASGRVDYMSICYYDMKDRQTQKRYKTKEYIGYTNLEQFPIAFEALRASK